MDATDMGTLDAQHNLTVEPANEEHAERITYIKKGHGKQTTQRPLGAIRLELALKEVNMSQTELAKEIGVNQPTINKIIDGTTKRSRYLPIIAKILNKNVNWLSGLEPNDKNNAVVNNNLLGINNQKFFIIPKYNKKDTPIPDSINKEESIIISQNNIPTDIDPNHLQFIYETDRAMSPDIKAGAIVTFNTQDIDLTSGNIYVIEYENIVCTRFLFFQPTGEILARAKEADFPDYTISPNQENFKILGRVLFVTNKF